MRAILITILTVLLTATLGAGTVVAATKSSAMARSRPRPAHVLALIALMLGTLQLPSAAASEGGEGCREVPHAGGTAEVCESQAWFNCLATNPPEEPPFGPSAIYAAATQGSWDDSPPERSFADGGGCVQPEGDIPASGSDSASPNDRIALGPLDGLLDSVTVRLFAVSVNNATDTPLPADVFFVVDGRGTSFRDVALETQTGDDGIAEVIFSIENLGFLGDLENRPHEVFLAVHTKSAAPAVWAWDASEVPASITFNPVELTGARFDAANVGAAAPLEDPGAGPGAHDATVVAIIDQGFDPYHWDFVGSKMPQHRDDDRSNDLPLEDPPDRWLSGFPDPDEAFASFQSLDLTFEHDDAFRPLGELREVDADEWDTVRASTAEELNYYWIPGSKVIGAVTFDPDEPSTFGTTDEHGQGTSSVAVGNLFGTCPECLFVFIRAQNRQDQRARVAFEWALDQPWIDVVSMSVLSCSRPDLGFLPTWVLNNCEDLEQQRHAAERGQTLFWAAGNGLDPTALVPNPTLTTSIQGPDWVVTVGGVSRTGHAISGTGKPADVAAPAVSNGASRGVSTVGGSGHFGGTSASTPLVAGTYARALHHARRQLPGPSRTQDDGVVAVGGGFICGGVRPGCELGDRELTAAELRARLFGGAVHTPEGTTLSFPSVGQIPPTAETEFLSEGHGSYFGRAFGERKWLEELDRILAPMEGRAETLQRPEGERDWMIVDSFCRQDLWGSWDGGYFVEGETSLPGPDPAWPVRTSIEATCPFLPRPPPT